MLAHTAEFIITVAVTGGCFITGDLLLVARQCACSTAGRGRSSFRKGGVCTSSRRPQAKGQAGAPGASSVVCQLLVDLAKMSGGVRPASGAGWITGRLVMSVTFSQNSVDSPDVQWAVPWGAEG